MKGQNLEIIEANQFTWFNEARYVELFVAVVVVVVVVNVVCNIGLDVNLHCKDFVDRMVLAPFIYGYVTYVRCHRFPLLTFKLFACLPSQ